MPIILVIHHFFGWKVVKSGSLIVCFHSRVLQIFSLYHWATKGNLFAKRGYPLSPNWKTIKNELKGLKFFTNTSLLVYFSVFQLCSLLSLCVFSFRFALFDEKIDNNSISENISTLSLEKHGTLSHSYSPKHLQDSCLSNE
jgi:hypothetical protein